MSLPLGSCSDKPLPQAPENTVQKQCCSAHEHEHCPSLQVHAMTALIVAPDAGAGSQPIASPAKPASAQKGKRRTRRSARLAGGDAQETKPGEHCAVA